LSSYFVEKKCPSRNIQVQQIICIHENKAAFRNRKAKYLKNSTQIERKRGGYKFTWRQNLQELPFNFIGIKK
jgi:hypothetical protein